ncbi:DUF2478 domain-containing protein [Notoacmeibacter ruber]|uniref:DUF2478 domain-containing protein n=1 Tax=Notoacmeibacter ruber TaxID=2670375 RepID=A0A3L7JKJ8_9HYPH|nr:DUF2478 domain-containing protein [Notoacmeibacter ruber]RLQ89032.1 DUF2478 domain-containing protein [Notoacmeibacter ruber]
MKLAVVTSEVSGQVNAVLADVAERLEKRGWRLAGLVQSDVDRPDRRHADMHVRVLPNGETFRISQDLGSQSRGCRLDTASLESAVGIVTETMSGDSGIDLLIVNKFGKREAQGGGFHALIAEAVSRDIPVLTAVNGLNRAAFEAFAGGLADELPAQKDAIIAWLGGSETNRAA